ncbi:MAG: hypothetical protein MJ132_07610, partial [Clostridia bacterium]|nr:hypothetical protein [Clostridia bacterium]
KAHGDGGSRVWLTETGISDNGTRNKTNVAANMKAALNALDTQVTFVDVAFIYKLSNVSEDNGWSSQETNYGIFYSGDDLDNPYVAKPIAKTIYSFFHNNTTDYSALTALTNRWAN